jgi:signal transduction histidine kinase
MASLGRRLALPSAVLAVGFALALLLRATARRLEQHEEHLRERKELERLVQNANEREKRHLGHELHEDLCQRLAGLTSLSDAVRKRLGTGHGAEAELVGEIGLELKASLAAARALAEELQPVSLESAGLEVALDELATRTQARTGIPCQVQTSNLPEGLDPTVAVNLYRIIQEAVANAAQHGQPRSIQVHLEVESGRLNVSVSDDGVGITPEWASAHGVGMRLMRYRCDVIGAELAVNRAAGGGTIISCHLPVPPQVASSVPRPATSG